MLDETRDAAKLVGLHEARLFAEHRVRDRGDLTALSVKRLAGLWAVFERFARAHEVDLLHEVSTDLVKGFIHARTRTGAQPAVATMHLRRDSIRLLFRLLRDVDVVGGDPTVDVVLAPRSGVAVRPLTDDEVGRCRWAALATVTATRQPAVWALGEAGASTREIAKVTGADVDLKERRVWVSGGPRTDARWACLTEWGVAQLGRRMRHLPSRRDALLAFDGAVDEHAGRISAGQALTAVIGRAGLAGESDVKPRSLTAWVGWRVWLETGRIDEAARRLGLRSLDLTAELIGFNWREHEVPS